MYFLLPREGTNSGFWTVDDRHVHEIKGGPEIVGLDDADYLSIEHSISRNEKLEGIIDTKEEICLDDEDVIADPPKLCMSYKDNDVTAVFQNHKRAGHDQRAGHDDERAGQSDVKKEFGVDDGVSREASLMPNDDDECSNSNDYVDSGIDQESTSLAKAIQYELVIKLERCDRLDDNFYVNVGNFQCKTEDDEEIGFETAVCDNHDSIVRNLPSLDDNLEADMSGYSAINHTSNAPTSADKSFGLTEGLGDVAEIKDLAAKSPKETSELDRKMETANCVVGMAVREGKPKGRPKHKTKEAVESHAEDLAQNLSVEADEMNKPAEIADSTLNAESEIVTHDVPKETAVCAVREVTDGGKPRGRPRGRPKGWRKQTADSVPTLPREATGRGRPRGWPKGRPRPKGAQRAKQKENVEENKKSDLTEEQRRCNIKAIWEECSKKIQDSRELQKQLKEEKCDEDAEWLNPETGLVETKSISKAKQLAKNDYYTKNIHQFARQQERKKRILESGKPSVDDLIFLKNLQKESGKRKRVLKIKSPKINCQICKETLTRLKFNHAFLCHGIEYRDVCAVCLGRDFANLEEHYRTSHWGDSLLKCHLCSEVFYSEKVLQSHIVSHTTVDPFRCPLKNCQFDFGSEEDLREHQRSAHKALASRLDKYKKVPEKRIRCEVACEVCGKMVSAPYQSQLEGRLQMHKKKYHDVQNHLKCPLCDRTFFMYSRLSIHYSRAHTPEGDRPFVCRIENCNKTFKTSYNLRFHKVYHRPPRFQCNKCKLTFYWPQPLKIHKCAATLARRMRSNNDLIVTPEGIEN